MQRAMARQAEAERERRGKVIAAEGEFQASERLKDAANNISQNPTALQLRFLQTMLEMSSERTTTLILPFPIDLFRPFLEKQQPTPDAAAPNRPDAARARDCARPALGPLVMVAPGRGLRPGAALPPRTTTGTRPSARSARGTRRDAARGARPRRARARARHSRMAGPGSAEQVSPLRRAAGNGAHAAPVRDGPGLRAARGRGARPRHVRSLAELTEVSSRPSQTAWRRRADAARAAGFSAMPRSSTRVAPPARAGRTLTPSSSRSRSRRRLSQPSRHPRLSVCSLLARELAAGERLVLERDGLICLCPYASRAPYELLVAPLDCEHDAFASPRLAVALAIAADAVRRLHVVAGRAPLNAWLHSAPFGEASAHWRLVIAPRLTVARRAGARRRRRRQHAAAGRGGRGLRAAG